ncbi:MAG: orotate phosphoribosyltransferase [Chloroflexi bacterium]|nr:orotate phosphoribosyltransferase [Chloroflexota bacterium]
MGTAGERSAAGDIAQIREQVARDLVRHAYLEGDFVLSSGRRSRYYFDKYLFETKPQILRPLSKLLAQQMPMGVDRIAGPELGAVALATAASLETGIPFVIVKKSTKEYGTQRAVEGEIHPGEKVVVIEDVMTTGTQAIVSAEKLRALGVEVLFILGIVDREEGARENVEAAGFQFRSLFIRSELESYLKKE